MLPFLKNKAKQTGVIIHERAPDEQAEQSDEKVDSIDEVESLVKDAIVSYSTNDIKSLAKNIKQLHDLLHLHMEEEESESDNTNYALQNARAHKQE